MYRKWRLVMFALAAGACTGRAAIVADWTFETSQPVGNGSDMNGIVAEGGTAATSSIASGHHASVSTAWTNPQGDASVTSFSANHWAVGDYFQFKTATLGYNQIIISFEQISSSTGPTGFKLAYSTDGNNFTDVSGAAYVVANPSSINWTTGGTLKPSIESFDLSSIAAVDGQNTIYFRLIDTTSPGGGTGTSRVDDFMVSATPIPELNGGLSFGIIMLAFCGFELYRQHKS